MDRKSDSRLRKFSIPMALLSASFLLASCPVAEEVHAGCDEGAAAAAEKRFESLRKARTSNPGSVSDEEFLAASQRYADLAQACYEAKYGPIEPQIIDDGGVLMPGSDPRVEE